MQYLKATDLQFIDLVKQREFRAAALLLPEVEDINVRDAATGFSVLHVVALCSAVNFLKAIEQRSDLDYGAVDNKGRTPALLACFHSCNEELATALFQKAQDCSRQHWTPGVPAAVQVPAIS